MAPRGWKRPFEDPIALPSGSQIVTLEDAAVYIQRLPKAEHDLPHWQVATTALIMAAEGRGPVMMARIGMLQALNAGKPAPVRPPRKKAAKRLTIIR